MSPTPAQTQRDGVTGRMTSTAQRRGRTEAHTQYETLARNVRDALLNVREARSDVVDREADLAFARGHALEMEGRLEAARTALYEAFPEMRPAEYTLSTQHVTQTNWSPPAVENGDDTPPIDFTERGTF